MKKNSFIFPRSYWDLMQLLDSKEKCIFVESICEVNFNGKRIDDISFDTKLLTSVWNCMKNCMSLTIEKQKNSSIVKEKKKKFNSPTVEDVILYFRENGYMESVGENAFHYYNDNEWKDINGKQVKNWKMKMRGVWFKDNARERDTVQRDKDGFQVGSIDDGIQRNKDGFQK